MIPWPSSNRPGPAETRACSMTARVRGIARRRAMLRGWLIAALSSGLLTSECCNAGSVDAASASADTVPHPRQRQQSQRKRHHQHHEHFPRGIERQHQHQRGFEDRFQYQHRRHRILEPAPPPPLLTSVHQQTLAALQSGDDRKLSPALGLDQEEGGGIRNLKTLSAFSSRETETQTRVGDDRDDDGGRHLRVGRGSDAHAMEHDPRDANAVEDDTKPATNCGDGDDVGDGWEWTTRGGSRRKRFRGRFLKDDGHDPDMMWAHGHVPEVIVVTAEEKAEATGLGNDSEGRSRNSEGLRRRNFLRNHSQRSSPQGVVGSAWDDRARMWENALVSTRNDGVGGGSPRELLSDGGAVVENDPHEHGGEDVLEKQEIVENTRKEGRFSEDLSRRLESPRSSDERVSAQEVFVAKEEKARSPWVAGNADPQRQQQQLPSNEAEQYPGHAERRAVDAGQTVIGSKRSVDIADQAHGHAERPAVDAERSFHIVERPSDDVDERSVFAMERTQDPNDEPKAGRFGWYESREDWSRTLLDERELRTFPDGLVISCTLEVAEGIAQGGQAVTFPLESEVLILGSSFNVSWSTDPFELYSDSATFLLDLDIDVVNVTLFKDDSIIRSYNQVANAGTYGLSVPANIDQGDDYKIAMWDWNSEVCVISYFFGISLTQSVTVSAFEGFRWSGDSQSPVERDYTVEDGAELPMYSCNGAVAIEWNTTGLMETVALRICQVQGSYGSLADLRDENLFNEGGGKLTAATCLEFTGVGTIWANASYANVTLAGEDSACGVYGDGFYANVSRADVRGADVAGTSNTTRVLGGVFRVPNESYTEPLKVYSSQDIRWEGLASTGVEARVDIVLKKKNSEGTSEVYSIIAQDDERSPTDGMYEWTNPADDMNDDDLDDPELSNSKFFLEVYDAVGGGLLCRSKEFSLTADVPSSASSDPSTLLLLLTPAALLMLCCCGIFCVACPYYDKIVRRRRLEMRHSVIDVDDTYVIDGEGQPAVLALSAQVIPLAHANFWPADTSSHGGNGQDSYRLRHPASGNWARTVFAMGHSVTESIGRAAGLGVGGGSGSANGSGNGSVTGRSVPANYDAGGPTSAMGGGGGPLRENGGSIGAASSLSSWEVMRSGATWAFGGGGSIGRRGGGRRDGGGVYPTAAAALGINQDLEEKSEAVASAGGGSSEASTASGGGGVSGGHILPMATTPSTSGMVTKQLVDDRYAHGVINGARTTTTRETRASGEESNGVVHAGGDLFYNAQPNDEAAATNAATSSSSWYSRQSSRVDFLTSERNGGNLNGTGGIARSGSGGSIRSGSGGLGVFRGSGAVGGESVLTVVVTEIEAHRVEIVEVARAIPIDDLGCEIPTTTMVGMEIMEGFSDHGSYDDEDTEDSSNVAVV